MDCKDPLDEGLAGVNWAPARRRPDTIKHDGRTGHFMPCEIGNYLDVQIMLRLLLCSQHYFFGVNLMAKIWELLDKAYVLINTGHINQARFIIEQILSRDPQNIEAWEVYIGTFDSASDLERLKDSVDSIWESQVREKDYLNANRKYILRRLDERIGSL
jgi:hypothetical protein